MITAGAEKRVLVATKPVDFRKQADGLAAIVQAALGADPFCGALPLAPVVRAGVAGITVSSRQGIDMHLHERAA
jgi:transposase